MPSAPPGGEPAQNEEGEHVTGHVERSAAFHSMENAEDGKFLAYRLTGPDRQALQAETNSKYALSGSVSCIGQSTNAAWRTILSSFVFVSVHVLLRN